MKKAPIKKAPKALRVSYATTIYGAEEKKAVAKVLANPGKIVAGPAVAAFEKKVATLFGKKEGLMVNSGSSANMIALSILDLPKGAEVITPALTFSTTLAPIIQTGLKPVFVDVDLETFVVNIEKLEAAITPKTKALMIPSLIGNLPDLEALQQIAKKHKLTLIEDSCDTLGPRYAGKPTGVYTDMTTTSFYASHIITTAGSGGMLCLHDSDLARKARVMAYWGRQSTLFGAYEKSEEIQKRFNSTLGGQPYDAKFIFSEVGFNFQPIELQGAFGLEQLKRFKGFAATRKKNFAAHMKFFSQYEDLFYLPRSLPKADTVWLAFPLVLKKNVPFSRLAFAEYLEKHDIQTRPIFTGNVLRQPAFNPVLKGKANAFPVADTIMQGGLLIGCHHGITKEHLDYLQYVCTEFFKKHS